MSGVGHGPSWGLLTLAAVLSPVFVRGAMGDTREGPDWRLVTPQAPWRARDSQGEFVFDDQLWILGG